MSLHITVRDAAPGIFVQTGLKTTPHEIAHHRQLVGRTIRQVLLLDMEGRTQTVLVLDNGKQVGVLCDPEGNGPGFLDIA